MTAKHLAREFNCSNKLEAIYKAMDKPYCRKLFKENDIPVPQESENDFPVIGRKKHHSKGRGFFVCYLSEDIKQAKRRGAVYFSKYYPKTDEYRAHIMGNKTIIVSEKIGDKSKKCWNHKNNFKYRHMYRHEWLEDETLMQAIRKCKKGLALLQLRFGAFDILLNRNDQFEPFVISEVNTAPSLSPLAKKHYIEHFSNIN